jgi:hypothetical protein
MLSYLFTNDLRISSLDTSIKNAASLVQADRVPSATVDKSANNNINTLSFYFNLKKDKVATRFAMEGSIRRVVLNFIKKFQFPNPRTTEAYNASIAEGVQFAPMRCILKLLYIGFLNDGSNAYLTREEIGDFLFFNTEVATNPTPNLVKVYLDIKNYREHDVLPTSVVP